MSKIVQDTVTQVQDPNIRAAYQPYFQRPEGEGFNRFLMDFGLNLMSTPPRGGFLSTAASAAKQPVSNLFDDLDAERMGKSAAEADLFKTLLQGNIDIAAEAAGNTGKGKTYAKLEIANILIKFDTFIQKTQNYTRHIASVRPGLPHLINCLIPRSHHIILIGPEGDFTSHELEKALENGYQPISLGKKILRTETAGIMSAVSINLINHY